MKRTFGISLLGILLLGLVSTPVVAQDDMTARGILEAHIEATGGLTAWKEVKDLTSLADISFEIPQMGTLMLKLESFTVFPGYGYTNIELLSGPAVVTADQVNQKAYYTPLEGWVEANGTRSNLSEVPAAQRTQLQRTSSKNELAYLDLPDSVLVRLDDDVLNEKPVYVISVTDKGQTIKYLVDKETKYIAGQATQTPVGEVLSVMSDYRDVGGFIFPFVQTAEMGGQGTQVITFTTIEVNAGLTAAAIAAKAGVSKKVATPE